MRASILALVGALAVAMLPAQAAWADDHHHVHTQFSVGFGYGYPGYYHPYGYYGPYVYPSFSYGFGIWPRYHGTRTTRESSQVRAQRLYVYPAAGQSEARLAEDRYQCHVWAVDATDFDPTLGAGTAAEAEGYGRAFTACMEGRNYVVK
ncbi:MAG TPA: hypothetical protein VIC71_14720 [Gammaproteobacteria bacterium]|jgi:hypothetical protein